METARVETDHSLGNVDCAMTSAANVPNIVNQVDLSVYKTEGFERGASVVKEGLWLVVSLVLFRLCPFKLSALKRMILRWFGAKVGAGVVIKPDVRITFPWKLTLGDHVWLGEGIWLLNLAPITIESHACISQRAFLCAGSHDYKSSTFDLYVKPITIEHGAWVGACAWIGPGVRMGTCAVLTANSVAVKDLDAHGIYQGNPAQFIRHRVISSF